MLKCSFLKRVCPLLLTVCFCAEHTRQWVSRPRVGAVPTSHHMKSWSKATATEEAWLINKLSVPLCQKTGLNGPVTKKICCSESIFIAQCCVLSPTLVSDQTPWNKQLVLVFSLSSYLRLDTLPVLKMRLCGFIHRFVFFLDPCNIDIIQRKIKSLALCVSQCPTEELATYYDLKRFAMMNGESVAQLAIVGM